MKYSVPDCSLTDEVSLSNTSLANDITDEVLQLSKCYHFWTETRNYTTAKLHNSKTTGRKAATK